MTTIEWAHAGLGRGETWNPIRAQRVERITGADPGDLAEATRTGWHCEKVSPACEHCYAERQNIAGARGGTKLPYKPGHRDNGDVRAYLDEKTLLAPLSWKAPRGIFVCSMTDAFGDWVLDKWLDNMFAVAALCPQHVFIFVTKRMKRMRNYLSRANERIATLAYERASYKTPLEHLGLTYSPHRAAGKLYLKIWPLPNVWLGCTAEDQQRADERVPDLLATPAAVRFVSVEPMLGAVDLKNVRDPQHFPGCLRKDVLNGREYHEDDDNRWSIGRRLDWVIAGGESGPDARPSHPDWFRGLRDQCAAARVPFFFKQWGEWEPREEWNGLQTGRATEPMVAIMRDGGKCPDDEIPQNVGAHRMARVGRTRAGRMLDGCEHNEFPRAR